MKEIAISAQVNYHDFVRQAESFKDSIQSYFDLSFEWDYKDYLDIIKENGILAEYDELLIEAEEKRKEIEEKINTELSKCINPNQPIWDIEDDYYKEVVKQDDKDYVKEDNCWQENGKPLFDIPAWYQPAHFNPPSDYGIYITKWGIVSYAKSLMSYNSNITKEEGLVSALALLWWHELNHAWVEDLCSIIESLTGDDRYSKTSHKYNSYIFMEEALCNSSAYGNLASVLNDRKPIGGSKFTKNTISNKNVILEAVGNMFRSQSKGYSDFYPFNCWVDVEPLFFKNIAKLLHEIYEYESFSVKHAISSFFDTARIIEHQIFEGRDRRQHHIDYGGYGHVHRHYLKELHYHANTLEKIGGELFYKYSLYGVHLL